MGIYVALAVLLVGICVAPAAISMAQPQVKNPENLCIAAGDLDDEIDKAARELKKETGGKLDDEIDKAARELKKEVDKAARELNLT